MRSLTAFSIVLAITILVLNPATANTIKVCENCEYIKIQPALDIAKDGDVIRVVKGEYRESLCINKSITLVGEQGTLLHPVMPKPGIRVNADNVTIEKFSIFGGFEGIVVENTENVTVKKCRIEHNFRGIYVEESSMIKIVNNAITKTNYSIMLRNSISNLFADNHISNSTFGIQIIESGESIVKNNVMDKVDIGVLLLFSLDNVIERNKINANDTAVVMLNSGANNVVENTASSKTFLNLILSDINTISKNSVNGLYADNNASYYNIFEFEYMNLTGINFKFSIINYDLPDNLIPLSKAINVTITPDIYTEVGYIHMGANLTQDEIGRIPENVNLSSIAFYRLDPAFPEKVSESFVNETITTNLTTKQSGIYILAAKKEIMPTPTHIPAPIKIPGFLIFYALIAIFTAIVLRRIS
ncbi:hypothetical protein DRO97_04010 [Archaeoglobales archaeon]|nr:MAG: hypothetical protein DRO97_04010 [Archaeoglobales archaeon]